MLRLNSLSSLSQNCACVGNVVMFVYVLLFTVDKEDVFHYEYFFGRAAEEASSTTDFSSYSGQNKTFTVI